MTLSPVTAGASNESPAASRACAVLFVLAEARRPLNLTEVAANLGLAKSSSLSILTALERSGLVCRGDHGYRLDTAVMSLAGSYLNTYDVVEDFRQRVAQLPVLAGEVVQLATLVGRDVIYLSRHTGRPPLFVTAAPGDTFPASITAVGVAMLADLADDELAERYPHDDRLPVWTDASVRTRSQLGLKIRRTRGDGHAVDEGETHPQVVGLAVTVRRAGRHDSPLAIGAALRHPDAHRSRWPDVVAELRILKANLESATSLA